MVANQATNEGCVNHTFDWALTNTRTVPSRASWTWVRRTVRSVVHPGRKGRVGIVALKRQERACEVSASHTDDSCLNARSTSKLSSLVKSKSKVCQIPAEEEERPLSFLPSIPSCLLHG